MPILFLPHALKPTTRLSVAPQGILLTPISEADLGGALGTDVLNPAGLVALTAGVAFQLYTASVNYARNAPEGYNAVKDVKVRVLGHSFQLRRERGGVGNWLPGLGIL